MNQLLLQRLLLVTPILLWMSSISIALQHVRSTVGWQRRTLCYSTADKDFGNDAATTTGTTGTKEEDDSGTSWDSDAYWMRQIHKQGEERPDYQWFRHRSNLPFECTACGKCCKTKGQVYMTPEEHTQAAELLGISKEDFIQQYASHTLVDETNGELWVRLLDQSSSSSNDAADADHGCIFLQEDNTCRIYEARPIQCSTYPFWPKILNSQQSWNKEVRRADDEYSGDRKELPKWTLEGGGCEGMQLLVNEEEEEGDDDDVGVPREQVYEQAYWYEHDERRFPRGKEIPVSRSQT